MKNQMDDFNKVSELIEVGDLPDRTGLKDTFKALVKLYGQETVAKVAKEMFDL